MGTLNDFITHYGARRYGQYFLSLSDDKEVIDWLASLDKKQMDERAGFLGNDLDRILELMQETPTQTQMLAIVRAVLCAESCSEVKYILPQTFFHPLKKEWTVETLLGILSHSKAGQFHLHRILISLPETRGFPLSPQVVNFLAALKDDELQHLMGYRESMKDLLRDSRNPFERLKQLVPAILEERSLPEASRPLKNKF